MILSLLLLVSVTWIAHCTARDSSPEGLGSYSYTVADPEIKKGEGARSKISLIIHNNTPFRAFSAFFGHYFAC